MKIFNQTESYCPICRKIVKTDIVEKNGAMFMEKKCPEHGNQEVKVAKHAWYYKGLISYWNNLYGPDFYKVKEPTIYSSEVTMKCSLNCPICYSKSPEPESEDISLDFFEEQLKKIKRKKTGVHLSGGECTERKDLPEMIRLISKYGHLPVLVTNGIRIANDLNYLKLLKDSGLKAVITWIDSVDNPEISKKLRGADFIELKKKAVENIRKLKIALQTLHVLIKGYNESEIESVLAYAKKFSNSHCIYGYNHIGKCAFSYQQEFLPDEMAETVASHSDGLFTLEDIYYSQKINYITSLLQGDSQCYAGQAVFIPRNKEKTMRETFDFEKFSKVLDEFEKIWPEDKKRAKKYFFFKFLPKLLKNPALAHWALRKKIAGVRFRNLAHTPHYLVTVLNPHPTIPTYDFKLFRNQCTACNLNLGIENKVPRCEQIANDFSQITTN